MTRLDMLARLSQLAGFRTAVAPNDVLVTRGGKGQPVCIEYSERSPDGIKWGVLAPGTQLTALDVDVVTIPARGRLPEQQGIAIRVESHFHPGEMAWVNISRAGTRFADRPPAFGPYY